MARPLSNKPKLTKHVGARVTDEVFDALQEKLRASGLSESDWLRRAILNNETTIVAAPVQTEVDRHHLFIVSKASNNLNQLAHVMNSARVKGVIDRELCIDLLGKLHLIERYLKATL